MTQENRKAGQRIGDGGTEADMTVAHGRRNDGAHYEPDPDQGVKLVHQVAVEEPAQQMAYSERRTPNVSETAIVSPGPSVWDARPPEDEDAEARGV